MNGSHARRRGAWWIATAVLVLGPALVPAAPFRIPPTVPLREDTHLFRRILALNHLKPLEHFNELDGDPAHSLLVVFGDTQCLNRGRDWLRTFVENGGAVLIASDQAASDAVKHEIRSISGVAITGEFVDGPHEWSYRGRRDCPIVQPARNVQPDLFADPLGQPNQPLLVATNSPSYLERPRFGTPVPALAYLPAEGRVLGQTFFVCFGVGGTLGEGRVLVFASKSIFSNELLAASRSDPRKNAEFAARCVRWLKEGGRDRVLLVNEGVIQDDFSIPITLKDVPVPQPTEQQFVVMIDEGLAELEEQNAFNHGLIKWLAEHNVSTETLGRWALVALALIAVCYAVYRVGVKARHKHDPNLPLLGAAVGTHLPKALALEQRERTLHRSGNLWEVARELARQWFVAAGAEPVAAGASGPHVKVSGGWWRRWRVGRRVRRLWRLAYGSAAVRVSAGGLRRLRAELAALDGALQRGDVSLARS
jgi:hypothetical protein